MKNDVLARRYAKAIYELGNEESKGEIFLNDLNKIVSLINENEEFKSIMESPLYDLTLKKRILKAVVSNAGVSGYIVNFLNILIEKDRFYELSTILQSYYDIISEASGKAKANVISAVELSQTQQLEISRVFSKITKKQVEIGMTVDASLIGGLVVEIEGMVYDGSIKSQLIKFKEILKGEM